MAKPNKYPRDPSAPAEQSAEASTDSEKGEADRVTVPAGDAPAVDGATAAEDSAVSTANTDVKADEPKGEEPKATADADSPTDAPNADALADQERTPCPECGSSWSEKAGCANAECAHNPDLKAAEAEKAEREARLVDVVAKARACRLCKTSRPCSPEHYEAMGYVVPDERFLQLFGPPLRLSESDVRQGSIRCRVIERVMVGHKMHDVGEVEHFAAHIIDSAPHCFEELR